MRTRFTARLRPRVVEAVGFPSDADAVVLWFQDTARERIRTFEAKIAEWDKEREELDEEPVEIDVTIDYVRKRRSLKANALMWSLYEIIVQALNKELRDRAPITAARLYAEDMQRFANKATFSVPAVWGSAIAYEIQYGDRPEYEGQRGKVVEQIRRGDELWLTVWRTSSFWNTKEMAEHIDRLLMDIADMGITRYSNGDLDKVFADYEKWRKQEKCE